MCGIAGIVLSAGASVDAAEAAVRAMSCALADRGPDAEGIVDGGGAVLGHRRLAILDLDARANQPMVSDDGRYVLVYNGEVYNFRSLRAELEARGERFRTTSDSEVLLVLYARERERMLPRLRGMFALAIWDRQARELFLARDAYGIKPLYHAATGHGFAFASQVRALRASGLVSNEPEPAGLAGFYLWGSVPEPWTIARGVRCLPSGHWVRIADGVAGEPVCWEDISGHWSRPAAEVQDPGALVRDAVTASVRAHLVADVPVSVFLSGGIDSGVVAGLAAEAGTDVEGITIAFDEFAGRREDEVPAAAEIAAWFGLRHHVRRVTRDEFADDVPRILAAMDQPSVDGVNTWFASKAVAERGYKVVLSGVGGDELFCGYGSFRSIPRAAAIGRLVAAVPGSRTLLRPPFAWLARHRGQPKLAAAARLMGSVGGMYFLTRGLFLASELPGLMGTERARAGLDELAGNTCPEDPDVRNGMAAVAVLEATRYLRNQLLRDSDWASMAHSLELRTPLVDSTLLATLGPHVHRFAHGRGKRFLGEAPRRALPPAVLDRAKTGFGLPMADWLPAARTRLKAPARPAISQSWAREWAVVVAGSWSDAGAGALQLAR